MSWLLVAGVLGLSSWLLVGAIVGAAYVTTAGYCRVTHACHDRLARR